MVRSGLLWSLALSLFLALMVPPPAWGQSSPDSKILRDTVALSRDGDVDISDTHHGRITVAAWDRAQVAYEAILTPKDTANAAPVSNPQIDHSRQRFALDQDGSSWSINIPGLLRISTRGKRRFEGHYRITMPKTAALEIDDYNSTVEVSGVEADVEIDTHQGKAVVDSARGTHELDTHAGTIEATALRGGADLETHSGRITASFGEFSEPSSAEAHSGSLRVFLPAEAGFTLQLDLNEDQLTVDKAFGTPTSSDDERRAYNDGGPTFELESSTGTVEVRPREAGPSSP